MLRRTPVVLLLLLAVVSGAVSCSSDDPEEEGRERVEEDDLVDGGDASRAITEEDLVDVPIEEICTTMGGVSEYFLEGQAIGGTMPDARIYLEQETPEVIDTLETAAELSPPELAEAMDALAAALEVQAASLLSMTDADLLATILAGNPDVSEANVVLNSFLFPQCGFDLPV